MNNLLALAKELGYVNIPIDFESPTQMVELMEHFRINVMAHHDGWRAHSFDTKLNVVEHGKTPMEAVLNCSLRIMEVSCE